MASVYQAAELRQGLSLIRGGRQFIELEQAKPEPRPDKLNSWRGMVIEGELRVLSVAEAMEQELAASHVGVD